MTGSDVPVPAAAAGSPEVTLVRADEAGGPTFAVGGDAGRCLIKRAPAGSGPGLAGIADR